MRILLALLMAVQGIAHLPAFLVNWQLQAFPEMPFRTTIFGTFLDVGDVCIKVIGFVWLAAGGAFIVLAGAMLTRRRLVATIRLRIARSVYRSVPGWMAGRTSGAPRKHGDSAADSDRCAGGVAPLTGLAVQHSQPGDSDVRHSRPVHVTCSITSAAVA